MNTLKVLIAGKIAGDLVQGGSGQLTFSYAPDYKGTPLSISMPISNRTYTDKQARPFFEGLLPENTEVRKSIARKYGGSSRNPFSMLGIIGYDCPGALQFCKEEDIALLQDRSEDLEEISESQIAQKLKLIRQDQSASWVDDSEHWSLGGQQAKFALRRKGDAWYRALGTSATTHIFKCGINSLNAQALNEYVCLRAAEECGINVVRATYRVFEDEPAIIIERFDRHSSEGGHLIRLHQEDFCQILGVLPENKYSGDGGPSVNDIIDVLCGTGDRAQSNIQEFMLMLFFNYLIAAPDAHAKNYSVLLGSQEEAALAPMYDVASMFPYVRSKEKVRVAMSIGGENRVGSINGRCIEKFSEQCRLPNAGISAEACKQAMVSLARVIPESLSAVFDEVSAVPQSMELRARMEQKVSNLCEKTIQAMQD